MQSRSSTSPDHDTVITPPIYPPIRFGDYALWFARKSHWHMADEAALPDEVVAPGARVTARW
jgi:hypothetical protein